ncbi:MAG TPA: hemolysin family protein [Dehalococcoidia bacterium]
MDDPLLSALKLVAVVLLVLANGFFVVTEFALVSVRRTRIDELAAAGHRTARVVQGALENIDAYVAATQLGITMASLGLGWIGEPALAHLIEPAFAALPSPLDVVGTHSVAAAMAFAVITGMHIVLGELAPKSLALQYPEPAALLTAQPTAVFLKVFWPFIWAMNGVALAVVRLFGVQRPQESHLAHSPQELKMLVMASTRAGVLDPEEEEMLMRVFEFSRLQARQVMVPRTEMVAVPAGISYEELIQVIRQHRHARLPVYEGNLDNVVGVLYVRDLLHLENGDLTGFDVRRLMREPLTVPETIHLDDLLSEMKRRQIQMAIAIDEFGGTAGLVTMEDLLERIIGEVQDEFEPEGRDVEVLPDGSALLSGLLLVSDVNEQFGLDLDTEEYDTIGGLVFGELGREPHVGDEVRLDGHVLRVERLDGLRIEQVRLSRAAPPAAEPADGTSREPSEWPAS